MAPDETWGRSQARDVFGVAARMLDGRIARLAGDAPGAIAAFTAAAAAEDALAYDEPSPWYIPAREMLAEVLLATGDRTAAKRVLQVEVARRPGNFKSTAMLEKLAG